MKQNYSTGRQACNLYKMEKEDYKFLSENITKTYKKSNRNKVNKLNLDAMKIADKLSISDRIDWLQKNEAYITAKDHNENFQSSPTFRLINPTNTNIGKISKTILDKISKQHLQFKSINGKIHLK